MKDFSINSHVYVQLTGIGISEMKRKHDELNIKQHDKLNDDDLIEVTEQ
jgi:hypothetical protein